jgi:hypothetical protein
MTLASRAEGTILVKVTSYYRERESYLVVRATIYQHADNICAVPYRQVALGPNWVYVNKRVRVHLDESCTARILRSC